MLSVSSQVALWAAVLLSGLYHGANPSMGWPLAVSNALMDRSAKGLIAALCWLGVGHSLAILVVTLPFGLLSALLDWEREIQVAASLLLIFMGLVLLIWRRHPRALVRIPPSRLALWSFAVAVAHGAGLMLVPVYLGLCGPMGMDSASQAATSLAGTNLGIGILVGVVHTIAMSICGGLIAWAVYRSLGLGLLKRSWFNLEAVWSIGLLLVGFTSLILNDAT
nr:hypothetical protein [Agrobacterium larrymoorei]